MKPNSDAGLLEKLLAKYGAEVDVRICGIGEQGALLREGHADVALLRFPHDDAEGLAYEELLTEQDVAVLPRTHRLAGRRSLTMADLADEQFPYWPGSPPNDGPEVRDCAQLMQLIALGRTIALLPASCEEHLWTDLVCVPVTDAPSSTLATNITGSAVLARPRSQFGYHKAGIAVGHEVADRMGAILTRDADTVPAPGEEEEANSNETQCHHHKKQRHHQPDRHRVQQFRKRG
jgi:hypothetical protein